MVALKILMERHPRELLSSLSSPSSQNMMLLEILDQRLPPPNHLVAQDIFLVTTLAFACIHTKPTSRPTMKFVSKEFLYRKKPITKHLHAISLWQLSNHEMYKRLDQGMKHNYEVLVVRLSIILFDALV